MAGPSYISFTEGAGKDYGTWQRSDPSNTVEITKVVQDPPYQATYAYNVTTPILIAAASHSIQVLSGATLRTQWHRVRVTQMVAAGAATQVQWQLMRVTTAGTGGDGVTASAYDPSEATAQSAGMTIPTSKGTEGDVLWTEAAPVLATVPVAGVTILDWDFDKLRIKAPISAAGVTNGIVLKCVTGVATATVVITVVVSEVAYTV